MALRRSADVCIIGGGIIGRCTALALGARGVRVDLISRDLPGAASRAAAGLLAPSIEGGTGPANEFAVRARDAYPLFLEKLHDAVGASVEHSRAGILEVALDDASERRLRGRSAEGDARFLSPNDVRSLEPALQATRGGVLADLDGYVDNVALMDALERATRGTTQIREVDGLVSRVELNRDSAMLVLTLGDRVSAAGVVLAAGAWSSQIAGIPPRTPVRPLKGEMIRYDPSPTADGTTLHRPVYGAGVYLVPRGAGRVLVGATSEDKGFDVNISSAAAEVLSGGATTLIPALGRRPFDDQWAGLRPMTGDSLPLLGADPEFPALLYACGHSRNGILKAPLTGECIAAVFVGEEPPASLRPFSPDRHADTTAPSIGA